MPDEKPIRARRYLKKLTNKLEKIEIPEIILPASIPDNYQSWVDTRSKQITTGELSFEQVGEELYLTEHEIRFSKLYMTDEDFRGNKVECAIKALGLNPNDRKDRKYASNWTEVRTKPNHPCMMLGKTLLHSLGFNDANVDKELLFLITQNYDLRAKADAIEQYNKLTGRLKKQIEITAKIDIDYSGLDKKRKQQIVKWLKPLKIDNSQSQ